VICVHAQTPPAQACKNQSSGREANLLGRSFATAATTVARRSGHPAWLTIAIHV
jgi:hypothetical protein